METAASQVPGLMTLLDRFIIMDDVELADISETRSGLMIAGPQAPLLLQQIGIAVDKLEPLSTQTTTWGDTPSQRHPRTQLPGAAITSYGPTPQPPQSFTTPYPMLARPFASSKRSTGYKSSKELPTTAPTFATANSHKRPVRPAPCTLPRAAT